MQNQNPPKQRKLVQLELALEVHAGAWDVGKRRRMGKLYLRWGRQLLVSANVLEAHQPRLDAPKQLIPLHPKKQALN